ncbi:MAG TPA: hypothetical protein ENK66_09785 [Arcobacter sp.]|jgi:hypothetical protein|nr:hypothetical protein [Arcobacter sp.]
MQKCLIQICKEFETINNFLEDQTKNKENQVNDLFINFMDCFYTLKEEKLEYPKEFQEDVKLYHEGFKPIYKKFADVQIRYLMLSDFYDFVRLTKKYKRK